MRYLYEQHMRGANSIAGSTEVARRDHISAERQGVFNMRSSVDERVRETGTDEGKASDQVRESDTSSDNSFQVKVSVEFSRDVSTRGQ